MILRSDVSDRLDDLVREVQLSAKYRAISPELIRRIGERELTIRRNLKLALKATKSKLHQVAGVYFDRKPEYAAALARLRDSAGDAGRLRDACQEIMGRHASTRERLPILDRFYAETLAGLGPVHSVLDVACGLNPLAIPWMPLAEDASYDACDIYTDLTAFLREGLLILGLGGVVETRDVVQSPPPQRVDLALLLKAIPCLEQVDKSAGLRLLSAIQARHILVSFPARSLGGYPKGMIQNYEARFLALVAERGWPVRRFEFASELAFLVTKEVSAHGRAG